MCVPHPYFLDSHHLREQAKHWVDARPGIRKSPLHTGSLRESFVLYILTFPVIENCRWQKAHNTHCGPDLLALGCRNKSTATRLLLQDKPESRSRTQLEAYCTHLHCCAQRLLIALRIGFPVNLYRDIRLSHPRCNPYCIRCGPPILRVRRREQGELMHSF
jgi:hypothetical protein